MYGFSLNSAGKMALCHLRLETRQPCTLASHSYATAPRLTLASQRLYPTKVPLYSATEAEYRGYCSQVWGRVGRRKDGGHVCRVRLKGALIVG